MSNNIASIQQVEGSRASFAFEQVKAAVKVLTIQNDVLKTADKVKLYSSYLKRLPSMIQVNGLGQAMAFYYTKKNKSTDKKTDKSADKSAQGVKNEYALIYDCIALWLSPQHSGLIGEKNDSKENEKTDTKELVEEIVHLNSEDYRMVNVETLALINWMRKFATGMSDELSAAAARSKEEENSL